MSDATTPAPVPPAPTLFIQPAIVPMPASIAKAISVVMEEVRGVAKSGENQHHNFKFAKVGDLVVEVQPALVKAGLIITQTEIDRSVANSCLFVRYIFILSHVSGDTWTVPLVKTGMAQMVSRSGAVDDKAHNKCHTAARKYFMLGLFNVPTLEEGDERLSDGDADANASVRAASARPAAGKAEKGKAEPRKQVEETEAERELRAAFQKIREELRGAVTADACQNIWEIHRDALERIKGFNSAAYDMLQKEFRSAVDRTENA